MSGRILTFSIGAALALSACNPTSNSTETETSIRVVGSSTVYPFSTKVAQEFRNKTGWNVVVESTGSGGGHRAFCEGVGPNTPDVTNSSRPQKPSESKLCQNNGVENVVEIKIGYDGIVVANAIDAPSMDVNLSTLYLGLAKHVPNANCEMVENPYETWNEIDPSLPNTKIEVYGPSPTSGTRDAFVEIAMEGGAKTLDCLANLGSDDFRVAAHTLREDGHWIDSGENDNALVQTLINTPTAIGVFGYSFLDQNTDKVKGARINGAEPTFENIATGRYPVARSLYVYVKGDKMGSVPGLYDFAMEFVSDEASAPGGYLEKIGLVPLMPSERLDMREAVAHLSASNL